MKKRKRIFLVTLAVTVVGGLLWWRLREPTEPSYQGKPLSYWLQACDGSDLSFHANDIPEHPTEEEADRAIRAMGTNAVPPLLRMLGAHDSKLKTKVMDLLQRQNWIDYSEPAEFKNNRALAALEILGPAASNAVPKLIHLFETDPSDFAQENVPTILGHIGAPAYQAIPMLLRATEHTNRFIRNNAVYALGQIHAEPGKVVPVLTKCINDSDAQVRVLAIRSLGLFGSDARSAVPALLERLNREKRLNPTGSSATNIPALTFNLHMANYGDLSNSDPLKITEDALKSIDPEAAAKAGIK